MTRILLVRHGESTWNADGRWQGQADPPLTDRGREQARQAAAAVGTVDAIVTSDLERAAETGVILARELGVDHVAIEPGLKERDAGPLSGCTRDEVHERFPGLLVDDPAGFIPGPDGHPRWPHGWELDADLWRRVEVALTAIHRLVGDGDVVAVTHGGVIYAIERRLSPRAEPPGQGPGGAGRGRIGNLGGCWIEVQDARMVLGERLNLIDPATTLAIEADRI